MGLILRRSGNRIGQALEVFGPELYARRALHEINGDDEKYVILLAYHNTFQPFHWDSLALRTRLLHTRSVRNAPM